MVREKRGLQSFLVGLAVFLGVHSLLQPAFVPPATLPVRFSAAPKSAAVGAAALVGAAPAAFADSVDDAAKALADTAYPLLEKVDWERTPQLSKWLSDSAKSWDPKMIAHAADTVLEAGLSMNSDLIVKAVAAHDKAIDDAVGRPGLVAPIGDVEEFAMAVAQMVRSANAEKFQAVYDAFAAVGMGSLSTDFMASLNRADVDATYKALLETAQVVKR